MKKIAIIIASHQGVAPALIIHRELPETELFYAGEGQENPCTSIDSIPVFVAANFTRYEALVFIGALGICVRAIAPCIQSKYTDPAVVNIDSTGKHVISVLSGHVEEPTNSPAGLPPYLGHSPSSRPKATTTIFGLLTPFMKDSRGGRQNPSGR